ncbi:MAG: SDR family oxidoreductase, partial [Elusimicrobia bacterium]|nr:SDR family oxidoreductase [Elusimicrobiota bacterium]
MRNFSAIDTLAGRKLLVTGSTGFLGKVFLSLLLDRQPRIGRVFVLVRGKRGEPADRRFFHTILASPVFQPLREIHGDGLEAFLRERVEVVEGDVASPGCGLSAAHRARLEGLDAIVHTAGLVALNPALDESLHANARGALHIGELAAALGAKLLHVSTAYVAGSRWGRVPEEGPARGPEGTDPRRTLAECESLVRGIREDADAGFLRGAKGTRRKWLIEERLTAEGRRLAKRWDRPNVYCFTKALGEALLATIPGLEYSILRPTIVESAWRFPFPGWNEGMTTSAPIVYAMLRGHNVWPIRANTPLDVIPVDLVATASLTTAAALIAGRSEPVYHLGTSDTNPFHLGLTVSLIDRYRRRHFQDFADGSPITHWVRTRPPVLTVPHGLYNAVSAPAHQRVMAAASRALERAGFKPPRRWTKVERELSQIAHIVATFKPFIHDHRWFFGTERIRALRDSLSPADAERLPYDPERIDWRHYWPKVHIEGLRRWVFPGFDQGRKKPSASSRGALTRGVRRGLAAFQRWLYGSYFSVTVRYASRVPSTRVLVAANHASHLDMGLIKKALGPSGENLASLAAQDYFFRPGWRRWFFGRFTNLVPIDR